LPLRDQHINLSQLRDNLFGLVALLRHGGPPVCQKTYFWVDQFNGGGSTRAFGGRRFDRLTDDDGGGRRRLVALTFAVEHQRDVMERPEEQAANEPPEPPVNRLPWRKTVRQRSPASARPRKLAQRVEHFAKSVIG
jgi:hypothetical protein